MRHVGNEFRFHFVQPEFGVKSIDYKNKTEQHKECDQNKDKEIYSASGFKQC
jgi:hypothetical protein